MTSHRVNLMPYCCPGATLPDQLRGDERFVTFTRDFVNGGKPVFAICHGPQLLISADVIRGRKLTAVKPIVVDVKTPGRVLRPGGGGR